MPLLLKARWTLGCVLVVAGAAAAWAQSSTTVTAGSQRLAGNALPGDQTAPQAAVNATGGYLVWQDNSLSTNGPRIRAQKLGAGLTPAGVPFTVGYSPNSKTTFEQEKPQVALLEGGGAAFVWQGGKGGAQRIYARFVGTNDLFLGRDIQVNKYKKGYQITPSVARLADGNLVVVWASHGQDGSLLGVFGQRLSPRGAKLGPEFPVNQTTLFNQRSPVVSALHDGRFVVAWVSELQRSQSSVDIYARLFDQAGMPLTPEYPLNPDVTRLCANPAIAASPGGGFAVAWSQMDETVLGQAGGLSAVGGSRSTHSWDVFVRLFDATGAVLDEPACANAHTYGDQFAPKIAALSGGFLVVWTSLGQDGSREGVFGRQLGLNGEPEGDEFQVNQVSVSRQIHPTVVSDGLIQCHALWTSFGAGTSFDLFARTFTESTTP